MKHISTRRILQLLCLAIPLVLAACVSMAPAINHDVIDYYQVNDLAANQIMLLNILRAKDGLPLHFSELSQIRGQLSAAAVASALIPFGSETNTTVRPRSTAALGITVSSSPSFDISSLDTKDFTDGVMSTITPTTFKFFLDEGLDYRMVLLLLAAGIRQVGSNQMFLNAPQSSRITCFDKQPSINTLPERTHYVIRQRSDGCPPGFDAYYESEFETFLRVLNNLGRVYPISIKASPVPLGPPFTLEMNKDLLNLSRLDPEKFILKPLPDNQYQLMAVTQNNLTLLCQTNGFNTHVVSILTDSDDSNTEVSDNACDLRNNNHTSARIPQEPLVSQIANPGNETPGSYVIKLRSTLEVIQYLGQILAYQQINNLCVTLKYEKSQLEKAHRSLSDTCKYDPLFHIANANSSAATSLPSVTFDGQRWFIPVAHGCAQTAVINHTPAVLQTDAVPEYCDHTLETLSMISLLLDQNKSVKDIGRTPAVQAVP